MSEISRREFLRFMGRSALAAGALSSLPHCTTTIKRPRYLPFVPVRPSTKDELVLPEGFHYDILLRWRQPINSKGELFGFNNDYLAYLPLKEGNPHDGLLWVNHEYYDPYYTSNWRDGQPRTKEHVAQERREVGGSIVHIRKVDNKWQMVEDSSYNRRLDGYTEIPLICERPIVGRTQAFGTFANCAGGVTPWGTVLTCEENYENFVGEAVFKDGQREVVDSGGFPSWTKFVKLPPEHYGWVVEVNLRTGEAKKLTGLGRFAHECATCVTAKDGRTVVYSGDDAEQEHLYKFIARKPGSLEQGELFVADTINGRWLPLSRSKDLRLKKAFFDHTELLIRAREAAKIVGATPLDRPEDIDVNPANGDIIVSLTNGKKAKNYFGKLLKIQEKNNDPLSLEFTASTFLPGGEQTGFACPDNLAFDRKGNLWLTTDISGRGMTESHYEHFGNNGLFYIPMSGPHAGHAFQVASAPNSAEFTGPCFAPDGKTLFLSVQHPGERANLSERLVSHWPDGGDAVPAPSVVAISGPALEQLVLN